jgi:type VI secretion system protein ImpH
LASGAAVVKRQDLIRKMAGTASRVGFFQLTRAFESLLGCEVGPAESPDSERVTFSHDPALAYPVSDVVSVEPGNTVQVTLSFLGLLGAASPLTPEWTDDVLLGDEEGALQAFYDLFHHRIATYLFAAWRRHSIEGAFDLEGRDILSARLRSMAGVDAWAAADTDPLPPMVALGLSDHQRGQPQTIDREVAEHLLVTLFPDWRVRLETSVNQFVTFTPAERARLGNQRSRLNGGLVYGDGCQDEAGLVRIHVGPVDANTYEALMPGGSAYVTLERIATRIFGATVDAELEVHLHRDHAPETHLGRPLGGRLGMDARYGNPRHSMLSVRVPLVAEAGKAHRVFVLPPEGA